MNERTQSLRARLWLLGITSVLGVLVLAAVTLFYAERGKNQLVEFVEHHVALSQLATEAYANGLQMGQALRNILIDPANPQAYKNHQAALENLNAAGERLVALLASDPEHAAEAEVLRGHLRAWPPLQAQVIARIRVGELIEARLLLVEQETPAWRALRPVAGAGEAER